MSEENLNIHNEIMKAVGNLDKVVTILKTRKDDASKLAQETDNYGNLPLHIVMLNGKSGIFELVKVLVQLHPEGVRAKNDAGELPIHLIRHVKNGYSAVEDDIFNAQKFLLQQFPDGSKIQSADDGCLPIHIALLECAYKFVALLLEVYPEGCRVKDNEGCLPIHHLACHDKASPTKTVQLLVDTYPEGCRTKNSQGDLPIHRVCTTGNLGIWFDALNILVQSYQESLTMENQYGNIPFEQVALENQMRNNNPELADFMKLLCTKHPIGHISQVVAGLVKYQVKNKTPGGGPNKQLVALWEVVQSRIDFMAKEFVEARKNEAELLSHVLKPDSGVSIEDLKSLVKSLDARLFALKKHVASDWQPSAFHHMLVSMVLDDDTPSHQRLVQMIKTLYAELAEVEEEASSLKLKRRRVA